MAFTFEPFLSPERPLLFLTLPLSATLRVSVLAPHPDDFDFIGVTLCHLRDNGNAIELAVLTSGASGVEEGFRPGLTAAGKAELREAEQRASCAFFGLPADRLTFLRLSEDAEGHLERSATNLGRLREWWDAHPADLAFLPHSNDTNPSHRRTYTLFREILAAAPCRVVALLARDPKTVDMREDVITGFDAAQAEWKATLLRFHQTQHQRNLNTRGHGIDDRILRTNREAAGRWGNRTAYAETFELECFLRAESKAS